MSTGQICNNSNGESVCRLYANHEGNHKAYHHDGSVLAEWSEGIDTKRIWYAGYEWDLQGEAVHVVYDSPDQNKYGARTNCPSCDGYGFHRSYCNLVKLHAKHFAEVTP